MQLDLLQESLFPATTDNQPSPPKKSKKSNPVPVQQTLDIPSKPLPESLQPEYLIKQFDEAQEERHDKPEKNPDAFKTISEAAKSLDVPQHVLRFWESRFAQIKPLKMAGGRRYYRPDDMEILSTIKNLLYKQGYTIKGAKKAFSSRKHAASVDIFTQEIQPFPDVKPLLLTKKQKNQLSGIRAELIGLRETLAPLIH